MQDDSLVEGPAHQRIVLGHHLLELLRRVDEEVEPRPYVVEAREVLEALEERASGVRHDDEIEVASGVSLASRDRAEGDHLPGTPDVGRDPSSKLAQIAHHRALHGAPSLARPLVTITRRAQVERAKLNSA
jgi:hypothetical protein